LPGPMPSGIWDRAVVLARAFGVCKIARAVGLDYSALRKKVEKTMGQPGLVKPTFVDLSAAMAVEGALDSAAGALIEISTPDGCRMRIHLEAGRGMEATGILTAFMRSRG